MEFFADPLGLAPVMQSMESSWLAARVRTSTWIYPLASVLHVLGLAFLLGSIAIFDLRVLGVSRDLPLAAITVFLLPVAMGAFVVQVATGFLMFAADATHTYDNPYFVLKLGLLLLALLNVLVFHAFRRRDRSFGDVKDAPAWAKRGAAISLAAWTGVAGAGRMIAYV